MSKVLCILGHYVWPIASSVCRACDPTGYTRSWSPLACCRLVCGYDAGNYTWYPVASTKIGRVLCTVSDLKITWHYRRYQTRIRLERLWNYLIGGNQGTATGSRINPVTPGTRVVNLALSIVEGLASIGPTECRGPSQRATIPLLVSSLPVYLGQSNSSVAMWLPCGPKVAIGLWLVYYITYLCIIRCNGMRLALMLRRI